MVRTRSQQMSRIRGRDTSPELRLRRTLWNAGVRYRVNYRTPSGRADLALVGHKIAVYVDGCFFHGCPLHYVRPRSRPEFWSAKLADNVRRDRRQTLELETAGWRVCRLWEHEVFEDTVAAANRVQALIACQPEVHGLAWRVVRADAIDGDRLEQWTLEDLRSAHLVRSVERVRTTGKGPRPDS